MSRVFISHSSANNAEALALAHWLEGNGWSDYFLDIHDTRGIAPGERWMAALAGAVDRCEAVLFLVSPAWKDSKYCYAEFFQAKNLGKRIFGVIVESIPLAELPELSPDGKRASSAGRLRMIASATDQRHFRERPTDHAARRRAGGRREDSCGQHPIRLQERASADCRDGGRKQAERL
jgi:hypothetical protein